VSRTSRLLPGLLLARIDGKSPVEYLSESQRQNLRARAREMLSTPVEHLDGLVDQLSSPCSDAATGGARHRSGA
jgi:hypothetical protein